MNTQSAVPGNTEERPASKSFRTVVLLCTPSYFALLMHVGALGFLDKLVKVFGDLWFLYPFRLLAIVLHFGGTLGAYVLLPIAGTIIFRRLWRDTADPQRAGTATMLLLGAVPASLFVLVSEVGMTCSTNRYGRASSCALPSATAHLQRLGARQRTLRSATGRR